MFDSLLTRFYRSLFFNITVSSVLALIRNLAATTCKLITIAYGLDPYNSADSYLKQMVR